MVEEPREQQTVQTAPQPQQAYQQAAPGHQQAPPPPAAQPAPSPIDVGGRVVRLLAGRAIWAGEQGWRLIEPRLGWLMLTGFLFGVIGLLSLLLVIPRIVANSAAPVDPRVTALSPAPAVEDFLRGQQTFDADLMWESFSPELRESLEGRDITRDTLAERVENERLAGQRYSGFKYIGGVELENRRSMYFYVVDIASPQQEGTISFVFTVGSDGKIVSVE
jgi:hypothetical protein